MVLRRSGIRIRPSILLTASNHFVYGTFLCILFFFFFLPLALHYLRTRTHIQTRGFGGGRWLERERKKTTRKPNQMGKKNKNTAAILGRLLHHRPRTVSVSLIRRFICSFSFKKKNVFFSSLDICLLSWSCYLDSPLFLDFFIRNLLGGTQFFFPIFYRQCRGFSWLYFKSNRYPKYLMPNWWICPNMSNYDRRVDRKKTSIQVKKRPKLDLAEGRLSIYSAIDRIALHAVDEIGRTNRAFRVNHRSLLCLCVRFQ